jgi:hypothetical protein
MTKSLRRSIGLAILPLAVTAVSAGETAAPGKGPVVPTPPTPSGNPLSFFDGVVTFDFQSQSRYEYRDNNFDLSDAVDSLTDDSWLLHRTRLGLAIKPTPWLKLYAQGQDAREFGSDRMDIVGQMGAEGNDRFDLLEGYIQLGDAKDGLSFKVGRQKLAYGDQRLVGPLEWLNPSRTFDAALLRYAQPTWTLDAFSSSVVPFVDGEFNRSDWINDDSLRNQTFSGLYFSSTAFIPDNTTDLYVFHLSEDTLTGDTDFATVGTRIKGDPKKHDGWDWETEMAFQVGEKGGKDLQAFAGHWGAGYVWLQNAWKPRLFVEYNYATGDKNPADGDVESFQNLFPTNHLFYGYMDLFAWSNIHNPQLTFSVQPTDKLTLRADLHAFWLAESTDAWYRANGVTAVRPINAGADNFAGTELDFTALWKPTKNLTFLAGYSHFFAGDTASATGASDDADFAYLQATITF